MLASLALRGDTLETGFVVIDHRERRRILRATKRRLNPALPSLRHHELHSFAEAARALS